MDLVGRFKGLKNGPAPVVPMRDGSPCLPSEAPIQVKLRRYRRVVEWRSEKQLEQSAYHTQLRLPPPRSSRGRPGTSPFGGRDFRRKELPGVVSPHTTGTKLVEVSRSPADSLPLRPWTAGKCVERGNDEQPPSARALWNGGNIARPSTVPSSSEVKRHQGMDTRLQPAPPSSKMRPPPLVAEGRRRHYREDAVDSSHHSMDNSIDSSGKPPCPEPADVPLCGFWHGVEGAQTTASDAGEKCSLHEDLKLDLTDDSHLKPEPDPVVQRWVVAAHKRFAGTTSSDTSVVMRECSKWLALTCNTRRGALHSIADLEYACIDLGVDQAEVATVAAHLWRRLASEGSLPVISLSRLIEDCPLNDAMAPLPPLENSDTAEPGKIAKTSEDEQQLFEEDRPQLPGLRAWSRKLTNKALESAHESEDDNDQGLESMANLPQRVSQEQIVDSLPAYKEHPVQTDSDLGTQLQDELANESLSLASSKAVHENDVPSDSALDDLKQKALAALEVALFTGGSMEEAPYSNFDELKVEAQSAMEEAPLEMMDEISYIPPLSTSIALQEQHFQMLVEDREDVATPDKNLDHEEQPCEEGRSESVLTQQGLDEVESVTMVEEIENASVESSSSEIARRKELDEVSSVYESLSAALARDLVSDGIRKIEVMDGVKRNLALMSRARSKSMGDVTKLKDETEMQERRAVSLDDLFRPIIERSPTNAEVPCEQTSAKKDQATSESQSELADFQAAAKATKEQPCDEDLSKLTRKELKELAKIEGASQEEFDSFDEEENPKKAAIQWIESKKVDACFAVGASVEYFCKTREIWLPAVVEERGDAGFYTLNIKPHAEASRIRRAEASKGGQYLMPPDAPIEMGIEMDFDTIDPMLEPANAESLAPPEDEEEAPPEINAEMENDDDDDTLAPTENDVRYAERLDKVEELQDVSNGGVSLRASPVSPRASPVSRFFMADSALRSSPGLSEEGTIRSITGLPPPSLQETSDSARTSPAEIGVCCKEGHPLRCRNPSADGSDDGWVCDGRFEPWGVNCSITDYGQSRAAIRFECRQCNFHLCESCYGFLRRSCDHQSTEGTEAPLDHSSPEPASDQQAEATADKEPARKTSKTSSTRSSNRIIKVKSTISNSVGRIFRRRSTGTSASSNR